jgi:hypothetical protein
MDKFNTYSWMLCPWLDEGVNDSNRKLWCKQILAQNSWLCYVDGKFMNVDEVYELFESCPDKG